MEALAQTLQWPSWLGTPSQVALFVVVVVALIKVWPILQAKVLEARLVREGRYGERIRHLETALKNCHDECNAKIADLNATIMGMRDQRASEQIAMMRAILRTVEDPELRRQMEMLEALTMPAGPVTYVGGPVTDGGK